MAASGGYAALCALGVAALRGDVGPAT
jgi:hypothetical protein